jgi:leucyl aminopeptidase
VVLLGLGKRNKVSAESLRKAAAKAARVVRGIKRESFAFALPGLKNIKPEEAAAAVTEGIVLGLHVYNDLKTDKDKPTEIVQATLLSHSAKAAQRGVAQAQLYAKANLRARSLVNLPSNLKSPEFLAEQARQIAEDTGLRCEAWDENQIIAERMGALYGVGMGSDNPPRFIVLEYCPPGREQEQPIILVGKGMTFDTGGYSIKPSAGMEDMKDDMAGAAVVLATMEALGELKPARRVLGIVPTAENMVNGHAQRPGDVVRARNGKTIEVLNTDAEGRLILADALSYASELKPAAIIDFATLTGAIGIALGQEAAGLFPNNQELADRIRAAGESSGDRVWPLPMWDEYKEHVKGTVSDVKNMGKDRYAGSIAGAIFLEHFVGDGIPWAHLDIAAVSFIREDRPLSQRGATGFGVRLTLELLRNWPAR